MIDTQSPPSAFTHHHDVDDDADDVDDDDGDDELPTASTLLCLKFN